MVNFQIVSDLHIETMDGVPSALSLIKPSAEVLILAGDIGRIHKYEQLRMFLIDVCQHFQHVLYVLGNHEYYSERGYPNKDMEELYGNILQIEEEITNLRILNRGSVVIGNICVIGCTLWSQALVEIPRYIVRIHGITTTKYNKLHYQDLRYIEKMITYCQNKNLKLVVITHHCPTETVIKGEKKDSDKYKSLYYSNLDRLLDGTRVHTWICGHLHFNFDIKTRNNTRLVSNQKGKPRDKINDFLLDKVITV